MTKFVSGTDLPVLTQKRLIRMSRGKNKMTDRQIAALYGVANQKYICDLRHGVEPTRTTEKGREARYAMGLDRRPQPKAAPAAASAFKLAVLQMAEQTRAALRWKVAHLFVKVKGTKP